MMRQVILDTETTGINYTYGHRLIELGCIEMINRKFTGKIFHKYINPERIIDHNAIAIHGITNDFLIDKPVFSKIADSFWKFIKGSELIMHNAEFDIGFIDYEFSICNIKNHIGPVKSNCKIIDTLKLARKIHPGQRNSIDKLCKRYNIDNRHRHVHGALLDAEILSEIYLAMTGGQVILNLKNIETKKKLKSLKKSKLKIIYPVTKELLEHRENIKELRNNIGFCLWDRIN
ncbi:DNA polymerase III subunit epsilon [Candidatus Portiera aleyrodidarum]|uniref:DNA polymerase III subunit epsilon n=1 Tax=Candidatus Portiera aleyrodidarum TV TaxID=1297582 RepID=A0A8D3X7A5_9GAMM|nr:DNA polymerase III subunit epsilon [Candidatus Portiera aleyrodidarum]AGI27055.1 DNA polymerase III, epsilon subunit [Candidatus Portiera aleyrodidarum TV]CEI59016.1 DNA polymerase III subunit epsilon [Candidatus Portiera aleyrodidarum]